MAAVSTGLPHILVGDAAPHTDDVAVAFGFADDRFDFGKLHSPDAGEKRPLVGVGSENYIQKDAVAVAARQVLQRQRDQIAEAAFGHRVLARKEAVVGIEPS